MPTPSSREAERTGTASDLAMPGRVHLIHMGGVRTKGQYTTAWPVDNLIISGLTANNNYNGMPPHILISLPRGVLFSALAILRGGLCFWVEQNPAHTQNVDVKT